MQFSRRLRLRARRLEPASAKPQAASPSKFEPEVRSLGKEAAAMKRDRWTRRSAGGAERGTRRHLIHIHRLIDLVTGTHDVVPVRERVAAKDTDAFREREFQIGAN